MRNLGGNMQKIHYESDSQILRLEFPFSWDVSSLSEVNLTIRDTQGNILDADIACTLWTASELVGAVSQYDRSIILAADCDALSPGDWLTLDNENVKVLQYSSTLREVTLCDPLRYDHEDECPVYGRFATCEIDVSNTDIFAKGLQLVLSWQPDVGFPVEELGEILTNTFQIPGLDERFSTLHPREYDALVSDGRLKSMLDETVNQLTAELRLRGIFIDRVVDKNFLIPCLLSKMRWLTLLNGDLSYNDERQVAQAEYQRQFELVCASPIWQDVNQDQKKSDSEVDSHQMYFERGF
jgi:hypothetical protein